MPLLSEEQIQQARSVVVINSTHDGQPLQGAVFALYRAGVDTRITEMTTGYAGRTREISLPQGLYNIVVVLPAPGYAPIASVVGTTIIAEQHQEITIYSVPIQTNDPTPDPTPPPVANGGRLLLALREQGTRQLLSGAVYELRRAMDNEFVAILVTDGFGEAAIDLPAGDYFLREMQAVGGFIPNPDRVTVRITANRINELNLTSRPEPTPPPPQTPPEPGRLIVTVRADGTREPIQGAIFEVRRAMDNRHVADLVTDRFGEAAVTLTAGDYFLRQLHAPRGFDFDAERITVRIAAGAIREISVMNNPQTQRDANIPYADYGIIILPQTGELTPVMNFVLGMLFLAVALLCGIILFNEQKQPALAVASLCDVVLLAEQIHRPFVRKEKPILFAGFNVTLF